MHDVCIAYAHFEDVKAITLNCLDDLRTYDCANGQRIAPKLTFQASSLGLIDGINSISAEFLNTDAEWIFWLDCDMGFRPDTLDRLLAAAHPKERPAVSALAFKCSQLEPDDAGGYITEAVPVIMDWGTSADGKQGFVCRLTYPGNALVQCAATGMACTLIHRSVYESIREKFGDTWHSSMKSPDGMTTFTPDVSFWCRAAMCGFPLFVHTGIPTSHQKTTWVSHRSYVAQVGEAWEAKDPGEGFTVADFPATDFGPKHLNRAQRRAKASA